VDRPSNHATLLYFNGLPIRCRGLLARCICRARPSQRARFRARVFARVALQKL